MDGAKLFVETEPHGDEGFGLFITRIESELELEKAIEQCSYKGHIKRREIRSKVTSDDLKTYDASKSRAKKATRELRRTADKQFTHIFKFEEFDAVCSAAKTLGGKFKGDSRLYKLEENYYILLSAEEKRKIFQDMLALIRIRRKLQRHAVDVWKIERIRKIDDPGIGDQ